MRELNVNEVEQVNGGIVALYWVAKGAVWAYRSYSVVRAMSAAGAGGVIVGALKEANGE